MPDTLTADVCPNAPRSTPPTSETALFEAAKALLPVLAAGRLLDPNVLRDAMTRAFGASDAEGAWVWKDAYEAAEAAVVLFLKRYGRAMRRRAGAGPEGPAAMLAMLQKLSSLEPSHTKRSEEQVRLQQFSTPLGLAYAALRAATIRPGDVVMEPSAGTGMLAVMAECALKEEGALHLNDRRDAFEGLRDTAAEAYRVETGEVWRPRRGSHVSQTGKLTSAMIDARDFQRARKDRENTAHLPQGTLVAVAGGKEANDVAAIIGHLDKLKAKYADVVLVHGGGPGAEKIAAGWAERNGVHEVVCKPDWDAHGRAVPFRRNDELLALLPKGVIAFPGSGITDNLVDKANRLGIPVQRVAA